ncbi:hypothetical protein AX14_004037 [Amanita brunnescens Koide BX004]|nr:hypothetical protein AX14_004037 [Amanita brunnescens Koide BX004]
MAVALASTTRIDEVTEKKIKGDGDTDSDASSDLRLSYLDDIPLKQRFPATKPPVAKPIAVPPPSPKKKPLTITLPATGGGQPLRSVTDILRELKTPAKAKTDSSQDVTSTRFGGAEVSYSSSALQGEAAAFAAALESANLPSQPSPPRASGPDPISAPTPLASSNPPQLNTDSAPADPSHLPTNLYD